jgi:hypothetical protein
MSRNGQTFDFNPVGAVMQSEPPLRLDVCAISIGLGGVLLAVSAVMLGQWTDKDFRLIGCIIFAASQVAGIVLGIASRKSPLGLAAAILSSVLLMGSLMWIG